MKKLIVGLLMTMAFASAAVGDIVIVANGDISEDTLSRKEIREIFLGKRAQWDDHSRIHVTMLKDGGIRKAFLKQYLNKSEAKWKTYWRRMVFTGRGLPPRSFDTEAELIEYVKKTKGSIGYVLSEGVPKGSEGIVRIIGIR